MSGWEIGLVVVASVGIALLGLLVWAVYAFARTLDAVERDR